MKIKFLPFLVGSLLSTSLFFSSCLDNDVKEFVFPEESSITSFSLGTVKFERLGKDTLGNDTTFIDTMNCAKYPFSIDQMSRTIENKDSLPVGADVSKVLAKISADTEMITYARKTSSGELKDTLWTQADSIDFTNPVSFTVYSAHGIAGKPYKVTVNVHKQVPNNVSWAHFATPAFASSCLTKQKTIIAKQTIYTFGADAQGNVLVESMNITNGNVSEWKLAATLPGTVNTYSAQAWKDNIYFTAEQKLYKLVSGAETPFVQVGTLENLQTLVGTGKITTDNEVLFALNADNKIICLDENGNMAAEQEFGFINNKGIESNRLSSISYPAKHNKSLTRTVLMSNNVNTSANDTTACVYNYTTNDIEWGKYIMPNPTTCPNLENISMIHYDNNLYAFGGAFEAKGIKPFEHFYRSIDNGLTWQKVTKDVVFPQADSKNNNNVLPLENYYTAHEEGSYSVIVDADNFMWFIWKNGSMTRGRINRLGFAPKW